MGRKKGGGQKQLVEEKRNTLREGDLNKKGSRGERGLTQKRGYITKMVSFPFNRYFKNILVLFHHDSGASLIM